MIDRLENCFIQLFCSIGCEGKSESQKCIRKTRYSKANRAMSHIRFLCSRNGIFINVNNLVEVARYDLGYLMKGIMIKIRLTRIRIRGAIWSSIRNNILWKAAVFGGLNDMKRSERYCKYGPEHVGIVTYMLAKLQTATSSSSVYWMISVQRLLHWIVPRFC